MATRYQLKGGQVSDFSGGPNLRDSAAKLALNEDSDAWNVTFDERGDVASRLGYAKDNASTLYGAPSPIVNQFYSNLLSKKLVQSGAKLYLDSDPATVRKTFTTSATVTFAELNSRVVAAHPVDGLFTSTDGITWTAVADVDAPTTGTCLAVWQNKLFVGLPDGSVHWSNAGDPTAWTSTDFNKLWEKDQQSVVNLHIGSGQDILGQPGLLAFKQESTYRIDDSATGSYTTVDATVGAAGPLAVVGVGAKVITISKRGISWWQEGQIGMVDASDRFYPLWQPDQVNLARQSLWCAGRRRNRAIFSFTRAGSTVNDVAIEFHPDQDWLAPRSDAMACYTTSTGTGEVLYGGSPSVLGQVYQLDSGGTDDGIAIAGRFQTRWFVLNAGFRAILWQIRTHGRGSGSMTIRTDYASGGGTVRAFDMTGAAVVLYDSGYHYDSGVFYVVPAYQQTQAFFSLGICREFSLLFTFSATTTADGPQVLGVGTAPKVGAFGLSSIEWLHVPLGLS